MRNSQDIPASVAFLAALQRNLSKQAFETWFRPLSVSKPTFDGKLRISVPNTVAMEWILSNYALALERSLEELSLGTDRIEWVVSVGDTKSLTTDTSPFQPAEASLDLTINPSPLSSSSLNEKYNFASFVVASCNQFIHAAY